MVRRARKPPSSTPAARSSTPWSARPAAASDDWLDVTSPVAEPARPRQLPRSYRRRLAPTPPPRRAVNPPKSPTSVFGAWTLSTPPRVEKKALEAALTCARRHSRRESLFATNSTGAGARSPKKRYTNRRCK